MPPSEKHRSEELLGRGHKVRRQPPRTKKQTFVKRKVERMVSGKKDAGTARQQATSIHPGPQVRRSRHGCAMRPREATRGAGSARQQRETPGPTSLSTQDTWSAKRPGEATLGVRSAEQPMRTEQASCLKTKTEISQCLLLIGARRRK